MDNRTSENTIMHHVRCGKGEIGQYVILPGDPGRVEKIAHYLDDAKFLRSNREYTIWEGKLAKTKITVMSTGMGGPSTAIGVEELIKCGAETLIRVGTCGGMDAALIPGDLIIPTGAIRKDGTGLEYVPIEFPAVPNFEIVEALKESADELRYRYHLGIVECKDSYYSQHVPETMPNADELMFKWKAWKKAGALASEMESATLFLVASIRRARAASILLLCRNREREEEKGIINYCDDTSCAIETAVHAIKKIINRDKEKC